MSAQLAFDLDRGRAARDAGMAQVVENAGEQFKADARAHIEALPYGWLGTGEDIRRGCIAQGIEPHHHNAWGGVIAGAIKAGLLAPTGTFTRMKDVRSHARKTEVYMRTA